MEKCWCQRNIYYCCNYSSCSSTNMWWLKNCCSFSLVKLMQSCSKVLNCTWICNSTVAVTVLHEKNIDIWV